MHPRPADSEDKNTSSGSLDRFLKRVLREHSSLGKSLAPDSIHDLRVALRSCRSLAEGFGTLDPHREWRRLHKSAKELQGGLAKLRDAQVMAGQVRRLRIADEAVARALRRDERKAKRQAERALEEFSRKRWKRWRRRLPRRSEGIDAAPESFARLALERLREVVARERRWRESGSQVAAHSLRIAVKRFRYTSQSFLPRQYDAWKDDLKRMQDALGDIHDLDVLHGWLLKVARKESLSHTTVQTWMRRIAGAREERVERYRKAVSANREHGPHAPVLWDRWRSEIEGLI